ncbi:MAG TPA: hypothetical protein VD906_10765 [Caulobacteraceae bacterium]|nr:hypothetical protein [Caulobacteraceae bacterium]
MSFESIGLGKILIAMYATNSDRIRMLRTDIRYEIKKAKGLGNGEGGDFYVPFWSDAKKHVAGELDLRDATAGRIASNEGSRGRLYPKMRDGFLEWWEEKRRLRNVPFTLINGSIKARLEVAGLGTIKVENTLAITIGDDGHRIIYPYFCDDPALSDEAARLGLWVMSQCIKGYSLKDMRVLDVIAGRTFSEAETPLVGNEGELFASKYAAILGEWNVLKATY